MDRMLDRNGLRLLLVFESKSAFSVNIFQKFQIQHLDFKFTLIWGFSVVGVFANVISSRFHMNANGTVINHKFTTLCDVLGF